MALRVTHCPFNFAGIPWQNAKESLVDALRPLVESPALRGEIGAASRAYVERVHDIDRIADRLVALYERL